MVALTAYTSDDYRERCLAAGFDAHIGKPYTINELTNALIAALAQVQSRTTVNGTAGPGTAQ